MRPRPFFYAVRVSYLPLRNVYEWRCQKQRSRQVGVVGIAIQAMSRVGWSLRCKYQQACPVSTKHVSTRVEAVARGRARWEGLGRRVRVPLAMEVIHE